MDLWSKILLRNQELFGTSFRGDLDAPRVVVLSEPTLGLSMELEPNVDVVWACLKQAVAAISVQVDAFAIACNTLNWYEPRIAELNLPSEFVSFQSVLSAWLKNNKVDKVGLLGASPITSMGQWSAYKFLNNIVSVETVGDPQLLQELIFDVKRLGSLDPVLATRFQKLVEALDSEKILLACTELPLISNFETDKELVDVTRLVADALVDRSLPLSLNEKALLSA